MARFDLPNIGFWPVAPPIADPRHGSGALSAVAMALSTPIVGGMILPELIRARHLGGAIMARPCPQRRRRPAGDNRLSRPLHA